MNARDHNAAGEFSVDIELSGIGLYLWDAERTKVTLVLPDGRDNGKESKHLDGTRAVPHAGYLRFDLRNLNPELKGLNVARRVGSPAWEVVYRFHHEEIRLGLPEADGSIRGDLVVPDFSDFAPLLEPIPNLLAPVPPNMVLMRTELIGGEFTTILDTGSWEIPRHLADGARPKAQRFGSEVHWTRTLKGDCLDLRVVPFADQDEAVDIRLYPILEENASIPSIQLKIANLCENPLEWTELGESDVTTPDDDFRWLYRLLRPRPRTDPRFRNLCPVPVPIIRSTTKHGSLRKCFSAQLS